MNYLLSHPISVTCKRCGTTVTKPYRTKPYQFCSRHCSVIDRPPTRKGVKVSPETIKKMSLARLANPIRCAGEKCHFWRGGISKLQQHGLRVTPGYRQWIKDVHKKFNYTCQLCAYRPGDGEHRKLHAHHVFSYMKLRHTDFERYITDVRNGLTVCANCHRRIHGKI